MGTPGLDASADYIAAAFKEAGLKPGGDDGTFFQQFTVENGLLTPTLKLRRPQVTAAYQKELDGMYEGH